MLIRVWSVIENNGDGSSSCTLFKDEKSARDHMEAYNEHSCDYVLGEDDITYHDITIHNGEIESIRLCG